MSNTPKLNRSAALMARSNGVKRYKSANSILQHIVDGIEVLGEHAEEARAFWLTFFEHHGTVDIESIKSDDGFEPQDHAMFWLGHAYAVEAMGGYNATDLADNIPLEKLEAINAILSGE